MADDSKSTPPRTINLYNVASDDALWVLETDHSELETVLSDPVTWVKENVKVGNDPAVLWEPFVVVFHEIPPSVRTPAVHTEGIQTPVVRVQGIHNTAILRVRYSRSTEPTPTEELFPAGETLDILKVGNTVHTHLHLTGFDKPQVARSVVAAAASPEAYLAAMNELPQTLNGDPTPPDKKLVFMLNQARPHHVVFHGSGPKPIGAAHSEFEDDSCVMSDGDANSQGQVIVDGVVVKTYLVPPPGGGG